MLHCNILIFSENKESQLKRDCFDVTAVLWWSSCIFMDMNMDKKKMMYYILRDLSQGSTQISLTSFLVTDTFMSIIAPYINIIPGSGDHRWSIAILIEKLHSKIK